MDARKDLAPIPKHWIKAAPQEVDISHANIDIEDIGGGRMALQFQNGDGTISFPAPAMQFWRWMDAVTALHLKRKSEWVIETVHTLDLEVVRLTQELQDARDEAERTERILKTGKEILRRVLRYFQHRDDLSDSQVQNVTQDIRAATVRDRPELFTDLW